MSQKVKVEEELLGFDAREAFLDPSRTWGASRRDLHLLRDDVEKPLSVDALVWPSLFGDGLSEKEEQALQSKLVKPPDWRGPNGALWENLEQMRALLTSSKAAGEHWIIAVSWHSDDGFSSASSGGPYREKTNPGVRNTNWQLLGFDVADAGMLSGLLDCGYENSERQTLRGQWSSSLNVHHLFTDLDKAFSFRDLSNHRVPEHAPFFVYGLWRLLEE